MDIAEKLKAYKSLLDSEVISKEEFELMKKGLLTGEQTAELNKKIDVIPEQKSLLDEIKLVSDTVEGVYIIDDEDDISLDSKVVCEVSGWSGWSGLLADLGMKNALRKMALKGRSQGCNVVKITSVSESFGISMKGEGYLIK